MTVKFSSTIGERIGERVIQLLPDSSTAFRRVYWKDPSHHQIKLFGVIRYTDNTNREFCVIREYEPSDRSCDFHVHMPHTEEPAVRCTATVKLPDGSEDTVVSYYTVPDWNMHFLRENDLKA